MKAGSISCKLISTREFVFLQSGALTPAWMLCLGILLAASAPVIMKFLNHLGLGHLFGHILDPIQDHVFKPCVLAHARVCVWAYWLQQQLCFEIPPTPPLLLLSSSLSPFLACMTCPMLNPLQTRPQPDSLINNLPELPILTNQGSCFSKPSKIERAQLPEIEGYVLTDLGWWSRPKTRSLGRASGGLASTALGRGRRRRCWIWMPD